MHFFNLKHTDEHVSFTEAVQQGLGTDQGLFFPASIPKHTDIDALLSLPFVERSQQLLQPFVSPDISDEQLTKSIKHAFNFPVIVNSLNSEFHCLELFHGPTLAFKDFGARFMAQCFNVLQSSRKTDQTITILTATSGDTGAAVAHAFYDMPNINVVILYPNHKISPLQEKLFTTLGKNIHTFAIDGTFDDCQRLVKQTFDDTALKEKLGLTSANSINISRLLAQVCYYFEGAAQLTQTQRNNLVISVPCGNFGNLTAGFIAATLGLPIKRFIAATNSNDTVPRYLATKQWLPDPTVETLSNAMDVSHPNNWPRIEQLHSSHTKLPSLSAGAISEEETIESLRALHHQNYVSEPHTAVAYHALKQSLRADETGLFLGTAHPAKFRESVEILLGQSITLPETLKHCADKHSLSKVLPAHQNSLTQALLALNEYTPV